MAKGQLEIEIAASPEDVWALLADYGNLSYFPGISEVRLEGEDRLVFAGSHQIRERLLEKDDATRTLRYSAIEGLQGIDHHEATISVSGAGEGSTVVWAFDVSPDEAAEFMHKTYGGALESLKSHFA